MIHSNKVATVVLALISSWPADGTNNHGLKLQKAQAICKMSKELKATAMRAANDAKLKITEILELENVFAAMIPNATKGTEADGCTDYNAVFLEANNTAAETVSKIATLAESATKAAGAAGRAAGVLDEFIAALAQAQGATGLYCIQGSGTGAATHTELADCFNGDLKPRNMLSIRDPKVSAAATGSTDLTTLAKAMAASGTDTTFHGDQQSKGCGLMKGTSDGIMIGQALTGTFAWAQGLLRFGALGANGIASTGVTGYAHTATASGNGVHWASDPEKIPVIAEAIALVSNYNTLADSIGTRAKDAIEKVKKCMKATNKEIKREHIFLNVSHLNRELQKAVTELDKALNKQDAKAEAKQQPNCDDKKQIECGDTPGCGWHKAEGKCEAKDGEGQKNQATGEKDANKNRCTQHGTNKEACEKENTPGQSAVCGFRKGKDGETDEPDKEKCRNGSFLTSKQFAFSVVSAAFMALLF
uniref:Variant surface glycoprotein MITAT 1.5 n=1 Tax=Trypanosoma brucei brucei TaxID=5702 RepID=VSM5_TRYBB|nr:RecName: Full=Variant surface glycoprotein MITAT 1.5; AltName: Full=VSG 118; Flags: Precursor [Trypanosoma brucei brucei]CAA40082.1 variant surface glycoprotein MITat 1.5 [Trypanosoma brucei]